MTTGDPVSFLTYVDPLASFLTWITLTASLLFAIRRFGLRRESHTFMRITAEAKTVRAYRGLALVSITVHLENKGATQIRARRADRSEGWLYKVEGDPDQCRHAGTLKIRKVPRKTRPVLFDWYSLKPLRVRADSEGFDQIEPGLEQINYLDEFQDPQGGFKDVHFWIEPHETYDPLVYVWLEPGVYVAKAFFLGAKTKHQDEEYWSCQTVFSVGRARQQAQSQRNPVRRRTAR